MFARIEGKSSQCLSKIHDFTTNRQGPIFCILFGKLRNAKHHFATSILTRQVIFHFTFCQNGEISSEQKIIITILAQNICILLVSFSMHLLSQFHNLYKSYPSYIWQMLSFVSQQHPVERRLVLVISGYNDLTNLVQKANKGITCHQGALVIPGMVFSCSNIK